MQISILMLKNRSRVLDSRTQRASARRAYAREEPPRKAPGFFGSWLSGFWPPGFLGWRFLGCWVVGFLVWWVWWVPEFLDS